MKKPWLSIVMPTYNGAPYLAAALESVAIQDEDQIEIIAVDDGSTDDTLQILQEYARTLPLKIVERKHLGNWVANTNYGIDLAKGEYVSCLHQDDYWLENRLRVLKALLSTSTEATMILHPSWYVDGNGRRVGLWRCSLPRANHPLEPDLVIERLLVQNFVSMPAPLFRREAALSVGGMDEELWYTADWDLWLKLAAAGKTIYSPEPLACFRIHPGSQTALRSTRAEDYRRQQEVVLDRHLQAWEALDTRKAAVRRAARFSIEVNTSLAACCHRQRPSPARLAVGFLALGPVGLYRFFRDSRVVERVGSRIQLLLRPSPGRKHQVPGRS